MLVLYREVKDFQIKIVFDGYPEEFGYWVDDDCPDIHPIGWGQKTGHPVTPPPCEYQHTEFLTIQGLRLFCFGRWAFLFALICFVKDFDNYSLKNITVSWLRGCLARNPRLSIKEQCVQIKTP